MGYRRRLPIVESASKTYPNELHLIVASIWEIIVKAKLGKPPIPSPVVDYVARQMRLNRLTAPPIRMPHLAELEALPPMHRDPFDRILVAQARAEGIAILSADPVLGKCDARIL